MNFLDLIKSNFSQQGELQSGFGGGQNDILSILQQLLGGKGGSPVQSGIKQDPFQGSPSVGLAPPSPFQSKGLSPTGGLDVQPRTPFGVGGGTPIGSLAPPIQGSEFNVTNPFKGLINQGFVR